MKCIQLRPLSWDQPKAGLKPGYTENPEVWFEYPNVPERYGILLEPNNLLVIDIDNPEKVDHNKLKPSFTVKTGGGGYHLYYNKEEDIPSDYTPEWGELKTTGHVVGVGVMHESGKRYSVLKDKPIRDICKDDLNGIIEKDEEKNNTDKNSSSNNYYSRNTKGKGPLGFIKSDSIREDVRDILKDSTAPHNKRVWMVGWLYSAAGLNEREIYDLIHKTNQWKDFDPSITRKQIESVISSSRNGRG